MDGENCINCSFVTSPNVIALIKSILPDTKCGHTKIVKKNSLAQMGRRYLENVEVGWIPLNVQTHGPFNTLFSRRMRMDCFMMLGANY